MKRNILIIVLIVLILGVVWINFGESLINFSGKSVKKLSEKEKFAKFSADLSCTMVDELENSESLEDAFSALGKTESVMDEYSYSEEEVQELTLKYENDSEFQNLALEYMEEFCPEFTSEINLN